MSLARVSESALGHVRLWWEAPEEVDEAATAEECVRALFACTAGWLELVALEARLGLYDRETFTEAETRPDAPFQLLRLDHAVGVRVAPMYRSIESHAAVLDADTASAWIADRLAAVGVADERYEPSLRGLVVAGSRIRVLCDRPTLALASYAGIVELPIEAGMVHAPESPDGIPDPVAIRLTNLDGVVRFVIDVHWSPWVDEFTGTGSPADRLASRGWIREA